MGAGHSFWPTPKARALAAQVREEFANLRNIEWSLLYVGFLGYTYIFTTYRVPAAVSGIIGDIVIGLALLGILVQGRKPRFTILQSWLAVFILWSALGLLFSQWSDEVWTALLLLLKVWLIAFAAINALRSPQQIRFFIIFFLVCYVTHPALGAVRNHFSGDYFYFRAAWNKIFANPNDLAALTILQISAAASLLPVERKGLVRLGAWASIGFMGLVVLLTQSRGAFIGLVAFGALTVRGRIRAKSLVPIALVAAIGLAFAPTALWERLAGLSNLPGAQTTAQLREVDPEGSAEARLYILKVASHIIAAHPITGTGLGTYPDAHWEATVKNSLIPNIARWRRDTHNTYFNLLAETGAPGLLVFLILVGGVLGKAARVRRRAKRYRPHLARQLHFLEGGLIGYLIAGIFGSFAKLSFLYLHIALILAVAEMITRALPLEAGGAQATIGQVRRFPARTSSGTGR